MKINITNITKFAKSYLHNTAVWALVAVSSISTVIPLSAPSVQAQAMLDDLVVDLSDAPKHDALPVADNREAPRTMKISVTAYNSEVGQTDSTPFHTADGTHVRDGIVAANFLPLGTRVKFPELYGDKEFVVKDRMNARYYYRADIWMAEKPDAIQFGHQYTTIEIY